MTNEQRIAASLQRNPSASNHTIAKNLSRHGVRSADVQAVREAAQRGSVAESPENLSGFSLTNKKIISHRPAETASMFIQRLPKNRGFTPVELSEKWHLSEETIRTHAKRLGCLKFLETAPGHWVQVVINPETAKGLEP